MANPLVKLTGKRRDLHYIDLRDGLSSVRPEEIVYLLNNIEQSHLADQSLVRLPSRGASREGIPPLDRHILPDDRLTREKRTQVLITYIENVPEAVLVTAD